MLCNAMLCNAMLCSVIVGSAMLCNAMLSNAMLSNAMLCNAMLCIAILCSGCSAGSCCCSIASFSILGKNKGKIEEINNCRGPPGIIAARGGGCSLHGHQLCVVEEPLHRLGPGPACSEVDSRGGGSICLVCSLGNRDLSVVKPSTA